MESLGRSCELFRELGDHQSLSSSLASRALDSSPEKLITIYSTLRTRDEVVQDCLEALRLARQTNSQAGQAFVEFVATQVLSSFGEFGPALAHAQEGLRIATAIEHQQWFSATYGALGQVYLLLLEPDHGDFCIGYRVSSSTVTWLFILEWVSYGVSGVRHIFSEKSFQTQKQFLRLSCSRSSSRVA